jgi:hypothetical protein
MQSASVTQAEDFLVIAARCRSLATTCPDIELSAASSELADELTARAGKSDQNPADRTAIGRRAKGSPRS